MASHRDTIVDQFTRQAVPFATAAPIRDAAAIQLIVDAAGTGADDTVLDVACGPGLVACAFARQARHVTGIDLTPAMLEQARALATERGLTNVTFQQGDVLPLPFADATFSIVVSRFAFHHFPDPAAVLEEMRRVCRPAGRVVVADLMASSDPVKAAAFHRMEMLRDPSHARALPLDELRGLFRAAGFAAPAEAYWSMEIDVEDLLQRSFPIAGSEATIRQMFGDAVADDTMGLGTRREQGRLRFTYRNVVLTALR
ncbi:MAG TPA: methyltransferase domain-containing protein [Candidatus Dormibacteraeota bacterium]|nr:methyltransferase domain-containing protein [Candidatus Dormibacteraeota bacterium]